MDNPIRILIVDDHPALRCGLVALLKKESDFLVVGEASDGTDGVEKAIALQPDVILMDLALPGKDGLQAIQEIRSTNLQSRILIFTSFSDGERVYSAIKAGALGYLVKDTPPHELFNAIRKAYQGKPVLNSQIENNLFKRIQDKQPEEPSIDVLTDREIEVLHWIAQGLTNVEIANLASVSEGTVRSHISNVLTKLELKNRSQVVIFALRSGLINIEERGSEQRIRK